jgi:hypothetical protein
MVNLSSGCSGADGDGYRKGQLNFEEFGINKQNLYLVRSVVPAWITMSVPMEPTGKASAKFLG